jgi:ACS family tartrate transporter-like MFS transporter
MTMRAIGLRIMPLLTVGYLVASVDRVNVGFAALQMNRAIDLSPSTFGFGAGIFFVAYSLFAVPGTLLVQRMGIRRGIALVMICWGLVSAATAFVQGPHSFYVLRFLLGATEAPFFPSVILYLSHWLPIQYRGRLLSILMLGLPLASVVGSPISAALLSLQAWGLQGWQWLFILEAAPAVLVGFMALRLLPASPVTATWLGAEQRQWLTAEVARTREAKPPALPRGPSWRLLLNPRVLGLAVVNIGAVAVTNGLAIWQPQIIRSFGLTVTQTGVLNALPFALGCSAMYVWAWHSDRVRERRFHTALPLAFGAAALGTTFLNINLPVTILVLCVAIASASMIKSPFWALATERVPSGTEAAAFGHITSLTNIGAFLGTYAIGAIVQSSGGFHAAMAPLIAMMLAAFVCALIVGRRAAGATS